MVEPKGWRQRIWRGLTLLIAAAAGIGGAAAAESVVTYHGAADRSGLYVAPALTWAKAATVRLDAGFHATVDGAVYSQPLYWVPPGGGAARIIVATEKNFVYALDASTGAQIWRTSLGTPVPLSALPCGNIDPMGVTGTPTIDPATGIVYLEAFVQTPNSGPRHMVFGLSLATGKLAPGWPVDVANGLAALGRGFNNAPQGQRSALTLVNGKLYVPYAGHFGDCGTYNGMVVGFNLATPGGVRRLVDRNHGWRQLGTERRRFRRHVHVRDHRQRLRFVDLLGRQRSGDPPAADARQPDPGRRLLRARELARPRPSGPRSRRDFGDSDRRPGRSPACSHWARTATPICSIARISEGSAAKLP